MILLFAVGATPAQADKRVALTIGNSAYKNVVQLPNPANDAAAVTALLKKSGFDVVEAKTDLGIAGLRRAISDFSEAAANADVAVVFYAGHGIEVDGTNYIVPVDASLKRDIDVDDEAVSLDRVLKILDPVKRLRLVILDACRDNPFSKSMKRTISTRSVGRGLARIEPTSSDTLIAFAAKAGSVAADGDGANSPFTAALLKVIASPGLDVRLAFGQVRDDVMKTTKNRQEPFVYGSLGGSTIALVPAVIAPQIDPDAKIRASYELAERIGSKEVWDSFIANYPTGFYADAAKAQRKKVTAEEARVVATEKAKVAKDEQTRLAIEGAKKAEQEKAAADTRKAEQARVAAELAKNAEETKVAEAERAKANAQAKAAEDARVSAEKKAAEDAKIVEAARLAAERKTAETKAKDDKPVGPVAALTPPDQANQVAPKVATSVAEAGIPRLLQAELKRVGCITSSVDDSWTNTAQKALALFNQNANTKLDVKLASLDALDAVKSKTARVCPLICEHGYKANGDRCTRITCREGYEVGDDNSCKKIQAKNSAGSPSRRETTPERPAANNTLQPAAKPAASGQIMCANGGCRPVRQGCRVYQAYGVEREICPQ